MNQINWTALRERIRTLKDRSDDELAQEIKLIRAEQQRRRVA